MASEFSTEKISPQLLSEIASSVEGKKFGSVEIYIENGVVTHITERVIKKYRPEKQNVFISKNTNQAVFRVVKKEYSPKG